jgi:glycosyltransferase involved in cell wall biosynthesis
MGADRPQLSIVVPLYNEGENLRRIYSQITEALQGNYDYEVIFVDDGSSDDSFEILRIIQRGDDRVSVIKFRKNFGQTAALSAGFERASGEVIVPLDADGQNDPADIPALVAKLDEDDGYDIVSGWRRRRQDNALTRNLPSKAANWLIAKITGVKLHDFGCTLKAYRSESLKEIKLYGEMHRFIPALASWSGEKVAELEVRHHPRKTGKTKYGLNRTFKVLLDLITIKFLGTFGTKPIYVFGGIGILCAVGSFLSGLVVLYQKFISDTHLAMNRNPLLLLTAILIITSIQFILMGLLAEILVRTYHESQDRPTYVIADVLENDSDGEAVDGEAV